MNQFLLIYSLLILQLKNFIIYNKRIYRFILYHITFSNKYKNHLIKKKMKHLFIKLLIIILLKETISQIQIFNISSINFSSQCCGLLKNFSFTLDLDSISLYSSQLDNIIYLESEDQYDLEMKINTTCFLEINSSKINCITKEDVSLLAKGPFRIPKFDSEIIFPCEKNKKRKI